MKSTRLIAFVLLAAIANSVVGQDPAATESKTVFDKPPLEIVSHKIGIEYYPMLDRPSRIAPPMTAETGGIPRLEAERVARQGRGKFRVNPEDRRAQGRLQSYTRIIDDAQLVQVMVKNTGTKPIKLVEWDFAFPRYEAGQLLSRYNVTTKVEIKPGGKKRLKHKLGAGAKRCEVVKISRDESQLEKISVFEAVCGKDFQDPSLHNQTQETISIKRIEYADGSEWKRP